MHGPHTCGPCHARSCMAPRRACVHIPHPCRRLYDDTANLLETKSGAPFPNKLPAAYRCALLQGRRGEAEEAGGP